MFMRSERLFLRPGWPEEFEELAALLADEAIARDQAGARWPYTHDAARALLQRPMDRMLPNFFVTLPSAEGARLIGHVGLVQDGEDVELGFWIGRPYAGRGYASEAARALLSLARALGYRQIVARHFADDPASGRVLAKLGFQPSGVAEEHGGGEAAPMRQLVADLTEPAGDSMPEDVRAA